MLYILARKEMRREKRLICFFGSTLRSDTEDSLRAPAEGCLEGVNVVEEIWGVVANVDVDVDGCTIDGASLPKWLSTNKERPT